MSRFVRLEPLHAPLAAALHGASFTTPWSEEEFAQLLAQPGIAGLMWQGNEPQGFILIRAVADEAEILTLAVTPPNRRRGVAHGLLDEACRILRAGGTRRLFLEVAADNAPAKGLYTQFGFVPIAHRRGYYSRGGDANVDALIMSLDFRPPDDSAAPHH